MLSALLLASLALAGPARTLSAADLEAVRSTHAATERLVTPNADWSAWAAAHYEKDATLLPPGGPAVKGREAIARYLASFGTVTHFDVTDEEIGGSGDVAYIAGVYDMTFQVPGQTPVRDTGKYIEVWRRQPDGSWRCHLDTFNSDAAGGS
jgi:ketosteroid isomerase-like protein